MAIRQFTEMDHTRIWELLNELSAGVMDEFADREASWQNWTPPWSDGTNPLNVGDGSLIGRFAEIGKLVHYHVLLTRAANTNIGTSNWVFGLPVPATSWQRVQGSGTITGGSKALPISVLGVGTGTIGLMAPGGRVSNTTPGGWAAGDVISFGGTYQRN